MNQRKQITNKSSMDLIRVEFNGQQIEAVEKDGRVWIVLKRLCENLGIQVHNQTKKVKENQSFEGGYTVLDAPSNGGTQRTFCIDLEILVLWLGSISASRVRKEVRSSLIRYQRECMMTLRSHFFPEASQAVVPVQTMTPAQQSLLQAQILVDIEQKQAQIIQHQKQQDTRIVQVESRLDEREEKEREAFGELFAFPDPLGLPPPRTLRSIVVERMRAIQLNNNLEPRAIWGKLYTEFNTRHRVNLTRRVNDEKKATKNKKLKPLDIIQSMGKMDDLYTLCCQLWPKEMLPTEWIDTSLNVHEAGA